MWVSNSWKDNAGANWNNLKEGASFVLCGDEVRIDDIDEFDMAIGTDDILSLSGIGANVDELITVVADNEVIVLGIDSDEIAFFKRLFFAYSGLLGAWFFFKSTRTEDKYSPGILIWLKRAKLK